MAQTIADISNYQNPKNMNSWLKALKSKYDVKSTCILLSAGSNWTQPLAGEQVYNSYNVFGNFSAYHFFYGKGEVEAKHFLDTLKSVGADKNTVVMVDAEVKVPNLTTHVNKFIDVVHDAGYKHVYVYSMASMFSNANNCINVSRLHHHAHVWVADYGVKPHMNFDAWQYTSSGIVQGIHVDLSKDYTGLLAQGHYAISKNYWKSGKIFKVLSDGVWTYKKKDCTKDDRTAFYYTKGSYFPVDKIVKYHGITRLYNKYGYITSNKKYVKKIK